jgi:hypothetical protein
LYKTDSPSVYSILTYVSSFSCYLLVGTQNNQNITWTWTFNGQTLQNSAKYGIVSQNNQSTININNLENADGGLYNCTASNQYGSSVRNTTLIIKSNNKIKKIKNYYGPFNIYLSLTLGNLAPVWPFIGTLLQIGLIAVLIIFTDKKYKDKLRTNRKTTPASDEQHLSSSH